MPSTIPENNNLGTDLTAGAAAFADIVLNDNIPFGGALPGARLFDPTSGDIHNSDSSYSASSWERDEMLDDVTFYSTTLIKQEPIDKVDTIFPLEVSPLSFVSNSSTTTIATTSIVEASRSATHKFTATSAHDDDDDEDEEVFDEEQLDEAELALERAGFNGRVEEPVLAPSSSTTTIGDVTTTSVAHAPVIAGGVKKVPKKLGRPARAETLAATRVRRVGRPPRAAAAAAAAAAANTSALSGNDSDIDDDDSDDGKPKKAGANKLKRKASSQQVQLTKSEQELAATLELSRDELLNMTSDSLEVYAQRLASSRPLTVDEQKKFKRQRRLIKNRESAQLSRMRKKAYVDELEKQIADINDEKDKLRRRFDAQARELEASKTQINHLRSLLASNPAQLARP